MPTACLADRLADYHEIVFSQQQRTGVHFVRVSTGGIVITVGGTDCVGVFAGGQRAHRGAVVDVTAFQSVGIAGDVIFCTGDCQPGSAKPLINICRCGNKLIVLGIDVTHKCIGRALDMGIGGDGISQGNIFKDLLQIFRAGRRDISFGIVRKLNAIPKLSNGILVKPCGSQNVTGTNTAKLSRCCIHRIGAGEASYDAVLGGFNFAIGGERIALSRISPFRHGRNAAAIAVNAKFGGVLCRQFGGSEESPLQLRRCLFGNFNLDQLTAVIVNHIRDQNHVTDTGRVQCIAKLEYIVDIALGGRTLVCRIIRECGAILTDSTPAHGNECGTVRSIVNGGPAIEFRLPGIEYAVSIRGGKEHLFQLYTVADKFTGVDGLTVGKVIGFTFVVCKLVTPAVYGLLADPGGIEEEIGTVSNILLIDRPGSCLRLHMEDGNQTQQDAQYQNQADNFAFSGVHRGAPL